MQGREEIVWVRSGIGEDRKREFVECLVLDWIRF